MTRRVVITGMGIVNPLGNNVVDTWEKLKAGQSAVDKITYFDTEKFQVKIAAEVKKFDPIDHLTDREIRRMDYHQHYISVAAREALQHSALEITPENAHRVSTIIGSSTGGLKRYMEYMNLIWETDEPRKMSPFALPMLIVNGGNSIVAIEFGAQGPSAVPTSACATGADCIGLGVDLIRSGRIDFAFAGCSDYPIISMGIAAFDRVRILSRHNENPQSASRPFDRDRDGMVFGEGCGVLVIEELEHAKARGAQIYAELIGYGSSTDAFHRTAPQPDGNGAAQAMQYALNDAKIDARQIDYINAHGTSTVLNDPMETKAIKKTFGDHAYSVALSSTKSMTGHAMGATSAMEAIFTVLSIRDQIAPPTINLNNPDPDCDLDYVPHTAREMRIDYAMSNSFGFGGHNTALVFRKFYD